MMLHDQQAKLATKLAKYALTPATHSEVEPVVLTIYSGAAHFQDYFTPDEADAFAAMWLEAARLARLLNAEPVT